MRDLRVGLAQIAPRLGDLNGNLEIHRDGIATALREKCDVIVFPELSLTGYLLRDLVPEVAIHAEHPAIEALAKASLDLDIVAGFVWEADGHRYYNASGYFSKGRLVHVHRKLYLPTYGLFDEGREFAHGDRARSFETPHGPAGMLICEDVWHQTPAWLLAHDGAELLYAISNGPTRGARTDGEVSSVRVWGQLLEVTARLLTSWAVYVNRVGCEDGLSFGGGSMVVDPFGRVTASLPSLDEGLLPVELDSELLRRARTAYPLLRDDNLDMVARELDRLRQDK